MLTEGETKMLLLLKLRLFSLAANKLTEMILDDANLVSDLIDWFALQVAREVARDVNYLRGDA